MTNQPKKQISLEVVLLFVLVYVFLLAIVSRFSVYFLPIGGFMSAFHILALAAVLIFLIGSQFHQFKYLHKLVIIVSLIVVLLGVTVVYQIVGRQEVQSDIFIHDGALQTEIATRQLLQGKNPYQVDYGQTDYSRISNYLDPDQASRGLDHYVYLPVNFLINIPFYKLAEISFGFFDQRFIYIFTFLIFLLCGLKLIKNKQKKILFLILFCFNPLFYKFFLTGFNDILVLLFIVLTFLFIERKQFIWSSFFLALAVCTKQSAWLLVPFYLVYLYTLPDPGRRWRVWWAKTWSLWLTISIIVIPWLIWGAADFWQDIFTLPSQLYPISGFGLAPILVQSGILDSIYSTFPFWILQLAIGLPIMLWLIKRQISNKSLSQLWFSYVVFLFLIWFLARFFNDSHLGFLSMLLITGFFLADESNMNNDE